MTQAAAPPPHLALTGADPSPLGQPQEQAPVDGPHAEVEIKSQLKPGSSLAKEEDPKPSDHLYKLQIRLCAYGISKRTLRAPTKENALALITVDIGSENTEE